MIYREYSHITALEYAKQLPNPEGLPILDVIHRIVRLNDGLRKFWGNSQGWAPIEAANLLSRSRLDWQVDLSSMLEVWLTYANGNDGGLILAWANLGSLVEGTMKLFLSVHYQIYEADDAATFDKGKLQEPDRLKFETLRVFFRKKIWGDEFNPWVNQVQNNRNTIHAFKDKDIGSYADLLSNVRRYLFMLRYINYRLPYPDSEYMPHEDLLPNNFSEDIF